MKGYIIIPIDIPNQSLRIDSNQSRTPKRRGLLFNFFKKGQKKKMALRRPRRESQVLTMEPSEKIEFSPPFDR